MHPKRLLTFSALLACLIPAAPAAAGDFGGVAVETYAEAGGGILAPAPEAPAPATTTATSVSEPVAETAQDDTPTTPEGQEQPEGEQNGSQTPTEENGGSGGETPGAQEGGAGSGGAGGETAGGFLPHTGLELAALTAIGLGLLLAGGALLPTSSWPPPRDRLSRPTRR